MFMAAFVTIIFIIMILFAAVIMILVIVCDGHISNWNLVIVMIRGFAWASTNPVLQKPNAKRFGCFDGPANDLATLVTIEQKFV